MSHDSKSPFSSTSPAALLEVGEKGSVQVCENLDKGSRDFSPRSMDILLFCVKQGHLCLQASFIPHPLELNSHEAIFLANPKDEWQVKVLHGPHTDYYVMRMDVGTLHELIRPSFNRESLSERKGFQWKDLLRIIPVSPSLLICFEQLFHHKLNAPFNTIFEEAKFLEIFSLIMESAFGTPEDTCPVAISPSIEHKLHQVRRHIIENIDEVPDPEALSLKFDLPRQTLREGYKYTFGKTIHQFHADHKLEMSLQMLRSGEMLVKEIAFSIGYQNPSHFIAAFKKKFGFTPKQFLKQEVNPGQ